MGKSLSLFRRNCDKILSSGKSHGALSTMDNYPYQVELVKYVYLVKSESSLLPPKCRTKERLNWKGSVMQDLLRTWLCKTDSWARNWMKQRATLAERRPSSSPSSLPHAWTLLLFPARNLFPHLVDSSRWENKGVGTVPLRAAAEAERVDPFCSAAWA